MSSVFFVGTGFLVGLVFALGAVLWLMRTRMIVSHRSRRTFDGTCAALETTVNGTQGWGLPVPTFDLGARFLDKDVMPDDIRRLKIFFLCNSGLASRVIGADSRMAGMMPCSWAVYELTDGSTWVAGMNIPLMSRMFSGVIGRVMRRVAVTEERFLETTLGLAEKASDGHGVELPRPA